MKSLIACSKSILLTLCLIFAVGTIVSAQQDGEKLSAPQTETKPNKLPSAEEAQKFYELTRLAPEALFAKEPEKAKDYSLRLLKQAETMKEDWNYGNAIHVANLVLGHIALDNGDVAEAKNYLLAAGKTPGSPQLDSFGPNMLLAKALLEKGETAVVLEYFDLCAVFWKSKFSHLEEWKTVVAGNGIPNFRANLLYHLNAKER